jgi:photosynthetic reaction center cytochrome c subunit
MSYLNRIVLALLGLAAGIGLLFTFERPPVDAVQRGYRGLAMEQLYNPRMLPATLAANAVPEPIASVGAVGPRAGQIYRNVTVLGDLSVGEFTRLMAAMTTWVAGEEGCQYCHVGNEMADEGKYQKQVTRRMLQMVRHINEQWTSHVGETGVTCYTCHRGRGVPANVWATQGMDEPIAPRSGLVLRSNTVGASVGDTSLPFDPFTRYLWRDDPIRVIGTSHIRPGNSPSLREAESTYSLMMHMSQALGVNCTFCHNSRSFADWDQSPPQRTNAWYGIRMVRDVNNTFLEPLQPVFPANRHGPFGDVLKTNCTTCHQGAYKPLLGVSMAQQYPEFRRANLTAPITVPPR